MNSIKRNSLLINPIINELLKTDWLGGIESPTAEIPPVNSKETETNFELELLVPGRKKDDFNIEVDKNVLTISTTEKEEEKKKEETYKIREFGYAAFKRSFVLPKTINEEEIVASYEDGILRFTFPKKEEALPKPKRLISLN